jgi:hypothetical protein
VIQDIYNLLSSLPGVVEIAQVRPEDIPKIKETEDINQKKQFVPLKNLGIQAVLDRGNLCVILKDSTFRSPPCPTIYLVEEAEHEELPPDQFVEIAGKRYRIIGEEVVNRKKSYAEKQVFFESDFVLFPERRRDRQHIPAFLIVPPIPFPELEKKSLSIENIMSVSPSAQSDAFLRSAYNLSKLPKYATILIGWDTHGA